MGPKNSPLDSPPTPPPPPSESESESKSESESSTPKSRHRQRTRTRTRRRPKPFINNDAKPRLTTNFLTYHRPRSSSGLQLSRAAGHIPSLTQQAKTCLRNLAAYHAPDYASALSVRLPRSRSAAVLVALFVGRAGDVYVLLSRRSSTLRTYAGDTSLPGGKVDPEDKSMEDTARREAFEEIGLPMDRRKVPLLCTLEPFLARNDLIVTPVVVLILDYTLQPILNKDEVTSLFSHPLHSFLDDGTTTAGGIGAPPYPHEPEALEVPYHSTEDFVVSGPRGVEWPARVHRFLTGREAGGVKPVFGLTASILIRVAEIAYQRQAGFEVMPKGAPTSVQRFAWALCSRSGLREAVESEMGRRVDWEVVLKIAEGKEEECMVEWQGKEERERRGGMWKRWVSGRGRRSKL
ncbi:hypothetical protein AMATHDRAFT_148630 [Amanita thiersii Skay4041]|uniref:Nudix hydrolase domain-containing protein n=1 Tax=Amanita thiersii Skay4041 TaxID=703135 RepID=A0A2A9NI22_9AGAR|nr:hypothetical protein AMATHDRAFT_148630 [Amanita thiersii Skay4041]